ncbi:odorant receptor 10a-like isoform X2 [Diachasmimorpha longicaudata]|uniref:odorant receptor 10a-like isoform X2 n=1 Tax=Diachasmimorpha longicaudata TaxID=58733 RepID=UPI0030B8F3E2
MEHTGRKKLIESCFRDCVRGDVLILQCMGLYSMVTFPVTCAIRNLQHSAQVNLMLTIEVAAALLTGVLSVFKGFRIFFRRKELYHILKSCQRQWMIQTARDAITVSAIENAKNTRLLRMCYTVAVIGTLESYNLRPYILYFKFRVSETNDSFDFSQTVYPAYYPFILKSFTQYFVLATLEHISLYFFALWWISVDCLFAQFNTYLAIQFNILATDIHCIDLTSRSASPVNTAKIVKGLKRIIREHVKLFSYVHAVEEWYNPIIFATILLNGLNLCSLLYSFQYRIADHNWKDAIKNATHIIAIIIQTLLYCSYAQRLSDEVNGFRQAVYGCSWINFNVPTKTLILLLMIYTEREYTFSAYGLFYLNMRQVTTIFSTAMRFFTILRNLT